MDIRCCIIILCVALLSPCLGCLTSKKGGSISFSKNKVPIASFGSTVSTSQILKSANTLKNIKTATSQINSWVGYGAKFFTALGPVTKAVPLLSQVLTLMTDLLSEADKTYEKLLIQVEELETRVFKRQIEGALEVIKHSTQNLMSPHTTSIQAVSELTTVVAEFIRILPIFKNTDSIMYKKYFLGAPLFVQLCGMFQVIYAIAEKVPEYNSANLGGVAEKYRVTLDNYRIRCIRARIANIRAVGRKYENGADGNLILFDIVSLKEFPEYFCKKSSSDIDCSQVDTWASQLNGKNFWNTIKYGDLRFKTITRENKQLWGKGQKDESPSVVDNWDHRPENEIEFRGVLTYPDTDEYMLTKDLKLMRNAILEYQKRVV